LTVSINILRQAYAKALAEPEMIAELKKKCMNLDVVSGADIENVMGQISNQPHDVMDRVRN
jgi:hypothetical protein